MGIKTEISWADSSVNPLVGCNPKCELGHRCYASQLVTRYAGRNGYPKSFDKPEFIRADERIAQATKWKELRGKDRPNKPWLNGMPRLIFVCDLADPFTESVPVEWLSRYVTNYLRHSPHVWLLLTKRPQRMAEFVTRWEEEHGEQFPRHIWGGTSVTSQATAWRAVELGNINSLAVRFISAEPLLGPLNMGEDTATYCHYAGRVVLGECEHGIGCRERSIVEYVDWVIVGGMSGRGRDIPACNLTWIRSIVKQCRKASVPMFVKQLGSNMTCDDSDAAFSWFAENIPLSDSKGADWDEWPEEFKIRQMPSRELWEHGNG